MNSVKKVIASAVLIFISNVSSAATTTCSNTSDNNFVSSFGQVYVGQDQYSKFIYQWIYWDNYTRLS